MNAPQIQLGDPPWLIRLPRCPSTNSWALDHLADLPHGSVVFTREQSAGRGQAGRSWASDPGVLTASWVCDLRQAAYAPWLSLVAGLAVAQVCEDCVGGQIDLKWPNDCYAQGRKLAGILCESRWNGQAPLRTVIGIGLNVAPAWGQHPPEHSFTGQRPPISLADLGPAPHPQDLLAPLRQALLEGVGLLDAGRAQALLPALRQRHVLRGQRLLLEDQREVLAGDLDDQGRLLVQVSGSDWQALDSSLRIRYILW